MIIILRYHGIIIIWYYNYVKENNGATMSKKYSISMKHVQMHIKVMAHTKKTWQYNGTLMYNMLLNDHTRSLFTWYFKVLQKNPWYFNGQ